MLVTALLLGSVVQEALIRHPFLSPIFSDHMVLQRGKPNSFWGWTEPGQRVRVAIEGRVSEGVAGPDGKWMVKLMPPKVGGPYKVEISGPEKRTLDDVLVGDVWICGGQSNMQYGVMGTLNGQTEIANASHPQIRFAIVPTTMAYSTRDFTPAPWKVCSPDTIGKDTWNGLSAVGYFFGRELQKELNVPIGLVHDCRGGSSAESWISRPTLEKNGQFGQALSQIDQAIQDGHATYRKQVEPWVVASDPGSNNDVWASPDLDDSQWTNVTLPASYGDLGVGWQAGVTWFRTEFDLAAAPTADATLSLGGIAELDWTWVNGVKVGSTYDYKVARKYTVPASALKAGRNQISIRVLNPSGSDGFVSPADQLSLSLANGTKISLAGSKWKMKLGPNLWAGHGEFPWGAENGMGTPLVHYNSMIHPIAPLAVKGVIWYQGETNVGRSRQYIDLMQLVASDWRSLFQTQDLPFLQVQLANYGGRPAQPADSGWAALREAQMISAAKIPKGGIATAVDVGNAGDIHPHNKQEVGLRLAKVALYQVYGKHDVVPSGPVYKSFTVVGSTLRVHFDFVAGGLSSKTGELKGFAIAGEDKKFHWATAVIEGNEVVLSSPDVSVPVAARYGWADDPELSLYNAAGLPAFPFRTDNWPVY